ncbi:hypothetical protein [Winogradskyella thalassocola]|uniref:Uncharacterized protein n=1 Tax=Winogradskyella thalassocola TaxID=262004 RepID=A0A1G8B1N6_9FLAO|nr:hypothetical protein [Winogradskyella thalassocola]SDH27182.1 hypothetical protein SAMN04489796_10288 [Winogradskyella thalassocola]
MKLKNKFSLGEIVTFKSHPLLYDYYIKGDGKLVPPFMIVSEVHFESKKKIIVDERLGEIIGERIKYLCVYFDDNRCQFNEVCIYESMLENYKSICIARNDSINDNDNYKSLIKEAESYTTPKYKYGNVVYFKTKKFEIFKKRISVRVVRNLKNKKKREKEHKKEITQYVVNYSSPDFILSGLKKQMIDDSFYPNGDRKKITSELLFKVKWFNSFQMKFSEHFLPKECFMREQPFPTEIKHNSDEEE